MNKGTARQVTVTFKVLASSTRARLRRQMNSMQRGHFHIDSLGSQMTRFTSAHAVVGPRVSLLLPPEVGTLLVAF